MQRPSVWLTLFLLVVATGAAYVVGYAQGQKSRLGRRSEPVEDRHNAPSRHKQASVPVEAHPEASDVGPSPDPLKSLGLDPQPDGVVIPWPANVPPDEQPDVFEANFRKAVADCGVDVDVVGVDCTEPPCTALFRRKETVYSSGDPWMRQLKDCDFFNDRYADQWGVSARPMTCPDGSEEGFTMLSFPPNEGDDWLDTVAPSGGDNIGKRWMFRSKTAVAAWRCRGE